MSKKRHVSLPAHTSARPMPPEGSGAAKSRNLREEGMRPASSERKPALRPTRRLMPLAGLWYVVELWSDPVTGDLLSYRIRRFAGPLADRCTFPAGTPFPDGLGVPARAGHFLVN